MSVFGVVSTMFNSWIYTGVILYLLLEFQTLAGGLIYWLQRRKEEHYEETTVLFNIVVTDTRLIFVCALMEIYNILIVQPYYPTQFTLNMSNPETIQFNISRILLAALIVHGIHSILMYERLSGMEMCKCMPLAGTVKRFMSYLKREVYEDAHSNH